ncbi:MAG: hypothetical protein ACK41T_03695 [Pseudobdellovibrio sp.]
MKLLIIITTLISLNTSANELSEVSNAMINEVIKEQATTHNQVLIAINNRPNQTKKAK